MRLSPIPPQAPQAIHIPQDVAVYRIKDEKGFFADDNLYAEGSIITWPDEPNLFMEPMNDLAAKNFKAFLEKLDVEGRKVAEKAGKSYNSYADAYTNTRELEKQEASRVRVLNGPEKHVPLMGAKKTRKSERIDVPQQAPAMGGGKFSLDGGAGQRTDNSTVNK